MSSRTVGFPQSGWRPWLSSGSLPLSRRGSSARPHTPRTTWFAPRLVANLPLSTLLRLCVRWWCRSSTAMTESPFAPLRRYLAEGPVPRVLGWCYPTVVALMGSCARPRPSSSLRSSLGLGVCAGCCEPLLRRGPSWRYLRESFPRCLDLYPGGSSGASTRFFPEDSGLRRVGTGSALHTIRTATSVREI